MDVKNRLLEIRLKLGYKKQIDFAKFLGMSRSKYNRLENNVDQPGAEDLLYISLKTGFKMEEIIYLEKESS